MVCSTWRHVAVRKNGDGLANCPEHKVKRACFKWGLGRELYTAPFIWVNADKCNIQQGDKGFQCFDRFHVEKIRITDGRITGIRIVNDNKGIVAYSWKED